MPGKGCRVRVFGSTIAIAIGASVPAWAHSTTERVSVSPSGRQGNDFSQFDNGMAISADGRFVAFESLASDLVAGDTNFAIDVFVRNRATDTTHRVSVSSSGGQGDGSCLNLALSTDGRYHLPVVRLQPRAGRHKRQG